jgi:hypothetical protein
METFAALVNQRILLPSQKTNYMAIETSYLVTVLAPRVRDIKVDEIWYLQQYPDVVAAINEGLCTSASEHYVHHGFYEHRMPHQIKINELWYLSQNTDVRRAVLAQDFLSGQAHFDELGYREGRLPYAGFSLVNSLR